MNARVQVLNHTMKSASLLMTSLMSRHEFKYTMKLKTSKGSRLILTSLSLHHASLINTFLNKFIRSPPKEK
jgi:hypothetical protein